MAIEQRGSGVPNASDPEAAKVEEWRRLYEATADHEDWLVAHRWDYDNTLAQATADDVRAKLELHAEDRVLEVGCGTGMKLSLVLHTDQPGHGFDLCEALVRRKDELAPDPHRLHLGVAEAARLPVQSDLYDKVFCYSVSQCFPSDDYAMSVLREMLRVCKQGGIVFWGDVFGKLEKLRCRLLSLGTPERVADVVVWGFGPIGTLRYRLSRANRMVDDGLVRRLFKRSFFVKGTAGLNCDVEFLRQHGHRGGHANAHYDVRIRKH